MKLHNVIFLIACRFSRNRKILRSETHFRQVRRVLAGTWMDVVDRSDHTQQYVFNFCGSLHDLNQFCLVVYLLYSLQVHTPGVQCIPSRLKQLCRPIQRTEILLNIAHTLGIQVRGSLLSEDQ